VDGLARGEQFEARFYLRESAMPQGSIKKLVAEKGFGFISGDREELFFHRSSVIGGDFDSLRPGQQVEYQVDQGDRGKGPRAKDVRPIEG
jgi:CspA family cold shock protein